MDFTHQYAVTRRFTLGVPRNLTVAPGDDAVYFLRAKTGDDPVLCFWAVEVDSGREMLLVDPSSLGGDEDLPAAERARRERARESASGIVSYAIDESGTTACFALGGGLFTADLADREQVSTIAIATVEGVFDPRLDPTGARVAYVAGNELRLVDLGLEGSDRAIATSDDPQVSWGRAEFIAGEEMGRNRGYWWSPDGTTLLVTRVDNSPVPVWWIGDPANPEIEPNPHRYPAAGSPNATVELWLATTDGPHRMVDWSTGGFEYLCDVQWSSAGPPLVIRQTRDQRTVDIAELDIETGTLESIRTITDDTWVELIPGSPLRLNGDLLTVEDTDSHRRLCRNGSPLTPDGFEVRSIVGQWGDDVLVTGAAEATEIHLAAVALDGGGLEQLTTDPGVHGAVIGTDTMVVSASRPDRPGSTVSLGIGGPVITDHSATPVLTAKPQFLGVNDQLRSALFLPADHDGETSLPVLLDPYGGPHAQRVLKSHNPHLVSQWFADQGYAVLVTDGRGTPGRGPAFERAVWGDLAQPVLDDQLTALDRVAAETGLLDLDRVAIRGWSFGGYLAALAVLRAPDRVHAAIAGAPVTSWRLYDTHYTERYLGHPDQYPEHYDQTDLILEAGSLTRPLLLIHGLADDNVVAAHTLQFSTALLGAGRPHSVLPLSGVTHMTPQVAVAENLLLVQTAFLSDALAPSPTDS